MIFSFGEFEGATLCPPLHHKPKKPMVKRIKHYFKSLMFGGSIYFHTTIFLSLFCFNWSSLTYDFKLHRITCKNFYVIVPNFHFVHLSWRKKILFSKKNPWKMLFMLGCLKRSALYILNSKNLHFVPWLTSKHAFYAVFYLLLFKLEFDFPHKFFLLFFCLFFPNVKMQFFSSQ